MRRSTEWVLGTIWLAFMGWVGYSYPLPAEASNWRKGCQSTQAAASVTLHPGGMACYIPTSSSDDSTGFLACDGDHADILVFDDPDGDGTPAAITLYARSCPAGLTSPDTDACFPIENTLLDGDEASSTEAIYGVPFVKLMIDVTAYTDPNDTAEIDVRCNGPLGSR